MPTNNGNNPKKKSTKKKATRKKAGKKKGTKKKKSTKKKTTKKKTTKKKATKKKATKKKTRRKSQREKLDDTLPAPVELEVQIWESYTRLRSYLKVADELNITEYQVRKHLDMDPARLRRILDGYAEKIASDREEVERAGLNLVYRLLAQYDIMLADIEKAQQAAAGTGKLGLTNIPDAESGARLTVPQAVAMIINDTAFSRLVDMITKLRGNIDKQRDRQLDKAVASEAKDEQETQAAGDDFENMDPAELAEILEQGGAHLPGILSRLKKQVENTAS